MDSSPAQERESRASIGFGHFFRGDYFILQRGEPYRDLGGAFFDRLDTTKATSRLVRKLQALGYDVHITPAA